MKRSTDRQRSSGRSTSGSRTAASRTSRTTSSSSPSSSMKRSPQRKALLQRRTSSSAARLQDRQRKQQRAFFLERLEDRSLLTTMIWTGHDAAKHALDLDPTPFQKWSNPANWLGSSGPTGLAPQP